MANDFGEIDRIVVILAIDNANAGILGVPSASGAPTIRSIKPIVVYASSATEASRIKL
jgi:hypothetical protein